MAVNDASTAELHCKPSTLLLLDRYVNVTLKKQILPNSLPRFPLVTPGQLWKFPKSPVSIFSTKIAELSTDHPVMPQWIGSLSSQNGNSLAGVFMINGEPWVFEKNARGQPAAPFQRAPAVVNIPWKELESIRQSLQTREPFTATIMGSTLEIVWSNGVRITANVPHCDTYGYFSGEGGWRTQ